MENQPKELRVVEFHKRDVLIWRSWRILDPIAFKYGITMLLPSGRHVKFMPCKTTTTEALKPVKSEGYREWVNMPLRTHVLAEVTYHRDKDN
jgi:hypothetical protein